jgi:hypothetical protein
MNECVANFRISFNKKVANFRLTTSCYPIPVLLLKRLLFYCFVNRMVSIPSAV